MADEKKDGMSVKELEDFAKKHRLEVFFCLLFLLSCVFGVWGFVFKCGWNILGLTVGAILSILMPAKIDGMLKKMMSFAFKQDTTIQLVFGIVSLVLAIFLPIVIFLLVGMYGGKSLYMQAMESSQTKM